MTLHIALIHGMMPIPLPSVTLYPLSWYLESVAPTIRVEHSSGPSITECVDEVKTQLMKYSDVTEWVFVGHSLGGIIATRLSRMDEFKDKVKGVVCFGSPLKGASLANVAKNIKPFEDNKMYSELADVNETPPDCPYKTFSGSVAFSRFDGKVFEQESKFDEENHTKTWSTHSLLAISPTVWTETKKFIEELGS